MSRYKLITGEPNVAFRRPSALRPVTPPPAAPASDGGVPPLRPTFFKKDRPCHHGDRVCHAVTRWRQKFKNEKPKRSEKPHDFAPMILPCLRSLRPLAARASIEHPVSTIQNPAPRPQSTNPSIH